MSCTGATFASSTTPPRRRTPRPGYPTPPFSSRGLWTRAPSWSTGISEGRLLATGYADFLPGGISSVYFAFEPDQARRSLGTWSVLREAALARESGRRDHYLGFWVPGAAKMDYKANFAPFEVARHGHWQFRRNRDAAIAEPGLGLESALAPVPAVVVEKP